MTNGGFEPYLGWINVADPENPPAGAKRITSEDLLRYENGIEDNENTIQQVISEIPPAINQGLAEIADGYAESAIWPDTNSDGLYFFRQGGQLVESEIPGLFDINPNVTPKPNYEIPEGVMVIANEESNAYTRPSDEPRIVVTFVGYSDPAAVALEGDRWDKLVDPVPVGGRTNSTLVRRSGAWV